jgi:ABC-type sugar transport system substrate-binding protein
MKDTMMFMCGAAMGVGAYMGLEALTKNKDDVKKTMNDLIDDTSKIMKQGR